MRFPRLLQDRAFFGAVFFPHKRRKMLRYESRLRKSPKTPFAKGRISFMEKRISVVSIIVSDRNAVGKVNACLHDYGESIIGRLGVPYGEKGVSVICIVMDAPGTAVSALSGKLGMIEGVTAKTLTSKI